MRLIYGESTRDIPVGEPVVLEAGQCRVTATRRFCWPATTGHELEPGKAYQLRILMQRQPPPGMVEIPAGTFQMGDPTNEGYNWERPKHDLFVGAFFVAQHQVTWALWREVYDWAVRHGYQFENKGAGYGDDHPVHSVNWYDAVKWCNAYSEREGRDPAYFEDAIGGKAYRQGASICRLRRSTGTAKAFVCRRKRNGRKPRGAGWSGTTTRGKAKAPGTTSSSRRTKPNTLTAKETPRPWAPSHRTGTACTTWPATFGSGAGIGGTKAGIRNPEQRTRIPAP